MLKSTMPDNQILQPSTSVTVASASDSFFYYPRNLYNLPAAFTIIRHKIFNADFGVFVYVFGNIGKAYIDYSLFLLVQIRPGFCQPGRFSNCIFIS